MYQAIKKIISYLGFQTYLGSTYPVREIPNRDLTKEEIEAIENRVREIFPEYEPYRK